MFFFLSFNGEERGGGVEESVWVGSMCCCNSICGASPVDTDGGVKRLRRHVLFGVIVSG